jgi:hypothetical protein
MREAEPAGFFCPDMLLTACLLDRPKPRGNVFRCAKRAGTAEQKTAAEEHAGSLLSRAGATDRR